MKCAECGGDTEVLSTRPFISHVMRRRKCKGCGRRWSTVEAEVTRYISKTVIAILRKFLRGEK